MRPGLPHLSQDFLCLVPSQVSKRRRICSNHLETRNCSLKRTAEECGHPGLTAVEKVTIATLDRQPTHCHHEVRAKDPIHVSKALQMANPGHWHSIRNIDQCLIQDSANPGIRMSFHDSMHTSCADVSVAPG